MADDLKAALEAGPIEEFLTRALASKDAASPQLVAAETVMGKAVKSGDPNMQKWADMMRESLTQTAEAEAMEVLLQNKSSGDSMGLSKISDMFSKFMTVWKDVMSDGKFDMATDLPKLFNALSGTDPNMQNLAAHRVAAQDALQNGQSYLDIARQNGVDVDGILGQDSGRLIKNAADKIDSIAPGPVAAH